MGIKVDFRGRRYEDRWTRYREVVLYKMGLSFYEIGALKFNRLTNPRVARFLKDIRKEVERIQRDYGLPSLQAAIEFRRENWEDLVTMGEIEEYDMYIRMGYIE